jgi:hypothetical protein
MARKTRRDVALLLGGVLIGLGGNLIAAEFISGRARGVIGIGCLVVGVGLVVLAGGDYLVTKRKKKRPRDDPPQQAVRPRRRTIGVDLRGGEMNLHKPVIKGMDTGVKQTGGKLTSEGLLIDGEPVDEEEEEGTDEESR